MEVLAIRLFQISSRPYRSPDTQGDRPGGSIRSRFARDDKMLVHNESQMKGSEVSTNTTSRGRSITIVSVVFLVFGMGIAVSTPLILAYIILNGSAPTLFGIEFLEGPNSLIGNLWGFDAVIVLGLALTAVSVLQAVAGFWMWQSMKK